MRLAPERQTQTFPIIPAEGIPPRNDSYRLVAVFFTVHVASQAVAGEDATFSPFVLVQIRDNASSQIGQFRCNPLHRHPTENGTYDVTFAVGLTPTERQINGEGDPDGGWAIGAIPHDLIITPQQTLLFMTDANLVGDSNDNVVVTIEPMNPRE